MTIACQGKSEYFGKIINGRMVLNQYGKLAQQYWLDIPNHYEGVQIDEFVIMPDHIHGIISVTAAEIQESVGTGQCPVRPNTNVTNSRRTGQCPVPTHERYGLLSKVINSYKNLVTKAIRSQFNDHNFGWQRSFYDHIVRNNKSLEEIRSYIRNNPFKKGMRLDIPV